MFVAVAMTYFERPWLQALIYLQVSFLALILLFKGNPFKELFTNYIEIFNETIVLLIGYHVAVLTGFNVESTTRIGLGVSIIMLVSLLIALHVIRWLSGVILSLKRKYVQ